MDLLYFTHLLFSRIRDDRSLEMRWFQWFRSGTSQKLYHRHRHRSIGHELGHGWPWRVPHPWHRHTCTVSFAPFVWYKKQGLSLINKSNIECASTLVILYAYMLKSLRMRKRIFIITFVKITLSGLTSLGCGSKWNTNKRFHKFMCYRLRHDINIVQFGIRNFEFMNLLLFSCARLLA